MMVELPPEFVQPCKTAFQGRAKYWLESLPALLEEACSALGFDGYPAGSESFLSILWRLQQIRPSPPGEGPEGVRGSIVLKLGMPQKELTSEIAALRHYNGCGACRLLDADEGKGMLLLELLEPGRMLSTLEDDERATCVAAEVMISLWEGSNDFSRYGK
jgi:streptomycin 6-kinase